MIEFKKWGNGSSCYEVIAKVDYNTISKTFRYNSIGMVQKNGKQWESYDGIIGSSRKEVAEKLLEKSRGGVRPS